MWKRQAFFYLQKLFESVELQIFAKIKELFLFWIKTITDFVKEKEENKKHLKVFV